eukprot:9374957-Karenia_brevis.AAC.1
MNLGDIEEDEIAEVLRKLQQKKVPGHDELSPEFWKICLKSPKVLRWIRDMCNAIWHRVEIPHQWHVAKVACLFKKGDPSIPSNYRPISLLPVGYKIFSFILLNRFKVAGAEERIFESQYGFKSRSGTRDAIFIIR